MKKTFFLNRRGRTAATTLACSLILAVSAGAKEHKDETPTAKEFVRGAWDATQMEFRAGELAQAKGQHEAVKNLGHDIVQDYNRIKPRLYQIASQLGIVTSDTSYTENHGEEMDQLKNASPSEFDKIFIKQMVRDHERDLDMLMKCQGKFTDNQRLVNLIHDHTPTVREHLRKAKIAAGKIGLEGFPEPDVAVTDKDANVAVASARVSERDYGDNTLEKNDGQVLGIETRKGDGEVLGLPTSNNDGTILGVLPAPSRAIQAGSNQRIIAEELVDGKISPGVENIYDADQDAVVAPQSAVGAPPNSEREQIRSELTRSTQGAELPPAVEMSLKKHGWKGENRVNATTLYETEVNGKKIFVTRDGSILSPEKIRKQ